MRDKPVGAGQFPACIRIFGSPDRRRLAAFPCGTADHLLSLADLPFPLVSLGHICFAGLDFSAAGCPVDHTVLHRRRFGRSSLGEGRRLGLQGGSSIRSAAVAGRPLGTKRGTGRRRHGKAGAAKKFPCFLVGDWLSGSLLIHAGFNACKDIGLSGFLQ